MDVYTNNPKDDMKILGGVMYCAHSQEQPVVATIFMISFLLVVAFVIVMLIIGTIGDAMIEASLESRRRNIALKLALQQRTAKKIIQWHETLKNYDRKGCFFS